MRLLSRLGPKRDFFYPGFSVLEFECLELFLADGRNVAPFLPAVQVPGAFAEPALDFCKIGLAFRLGFAEILVHIAGLLVRCAAAVVESAHHRAGIGPDDQRRDVKVTVEARSQFLFLVASARTCPVLF